MYSLLVRPIFEDPPPPERYVFTQSILSFNPTYYEDLTFVGLYAVEEAYETKPKEPVRGVVFSKRRGD